MLSLQGLPGDLSVPKEVQVSVVLSSADRMIMFSFLEFFFCHFNERRLVSWGRREVILGMALANRPPSQSGPQTIVPVPRVHRRMGVWQQGPDGDTA